MNEQRADSVSTTATPSQRDSPRNTSSNHVRHWSQPHTIPSRLSKQDSPLTSSSIPNPRYHKLPTQLARRQSSSYNHVKNNALVSNSPFKMGSTVKASRIPALTHSQFPPRDENKPDFGSFNRRQSKGLHVLAKGQVVSNSPFRNDKSKPAPKPERPERGRSLTPTQPSAPPSAMSSVSSIPPAQSTRVDPDAAYLSNVPHPTPSPDPRPTGTFNMEAVPSPKSVLVSPKRFHGPRSLSASPGAELKAQRRKTVTFVELIDVLEFDKDEVSDVAYSSADEYGSPDTQSPITSSRENSFDISVEDIPIAHPLEGSAIVNDRPLPRTPHISSDDVRRRLVEHRSNEYEEAEDSFNQTFSDASSFANNSFQQAPTHPAFIEATSIANGGRFSTPLAPSNEANSSVDLNSNTSNADLQAALDSLILGVEKELKVHQQERPEPDLSVDFGENSLINTSDSFHMPLSDNTEDSQVLNSQASISSQVLESPESGSTDDDNDEPATPREHNSQLPHLPVDNLKDVDAELNSMSTLTEKSLRSSFNKSAEISSPDLSVENMSVSELHLTSAEIETSSPPRRDPASSASRNLSSSLVLPPLSFDEPLEASCSLNMDIDVASFKKPSNLDETSTIEPSFNSSSNTAPPVPPKDDGTIQRREELIKAQRRELRSDSQRPATYHEGQPSRRRRSLSTGDAEGHQFQVPNAQRHGEILRNLTDPTLLDVPLEQAESDCALSDVIDKELKLRRKPTVKEQQVRNKLYKLREREDTIYAASDDKISHSRQAGDVDAGKAWKTVRRPSDMNEHSQLIKQYRAQQKPGKAYGKVFVRVMGIRKLNIPMPNDPTPFTCTLNNGIHFVTTPECRLGREARIEQEFELIEHSKLEFKLTLKIQRTREIEAQIRINSTPPMTMTIPTPPPPPPPASSRNVRSFFGVGGSPKKLHKIAVVPTPTPPHPPHPQTPEPVIKDNFARYLKPDGTLAQTLVSFKEIASRCDTRIFESSFPLIGQRTTGFGKSATVTPWTVGEIVLKIFRLPPLPGIPNDQLPQSLDECHRGLQFTSWHKVTYHEGVLTQNGGDCRTWRRRLLRVIGSNLIAFNDVTKKPTASIDLKKAIAVEDDDAASLANFTPKVKRPLDEFNEVYKLERSFRLMFSDGEEITFFADTDEAKQTWLKVLGALVGHIPPNPLWAELAWQRQEEIRQEGLVASNGAPALASGTKLQ